MTDIEIPLLPLAIAAIIVLSAVALPIVPTGGPSAETSGTVQTPDPVTSEPDADTDADAPTPADAELYAVPDSHTQTATSGLAEPEVHASTGSQTMSVRATTAADQPAIVLEDTDTHEGRWVSISTEWFRSEVGSVPAYVTIEHSSGDRYNAKTYARSGGTAFYVEEFSSNTVTFSGETSISASPATDGTTLQYELSSTDSVSDPTVNLTGVTTNESDYRVNTISVGGSTTHSVGGNTDPSEGYLEVESTSPATNYHTYNDFENTNPHTEYLSVSNMDTLDTVKIEIETNANTDSTYGGDIYLDGNKIGSWSTDSATRINKAIDVNKDVSGQSSVKVEVYDDADNAYVDDGYTWYVQSVDPSNLTYDVGATTLTQSGSVDLSTGENDVSVSGDGSGTVDYNLSWVERTQTTDPTIELNSQTVSHSGTLADGETVSKSFDNSTLQEGTNTINVSVGDGTLSADAPSPVVDLNYRHKSSDDIATDYTAGKWIESYNVSKTYADDGKNATLTIPFESDVYAIESVETNYNGSGWTTTSDYTLENTTLTVQLGDVDSGEEVAVRTTGYRVQPVNASITVADPTTSGDLDSRIRVESWDSAEDSYLSLGGTPEGDRLHYIHDASYSEDHELEVTANGYHRLYLANVGTDDEFNVSTVPYRINAETGEVRYTINDTSEERFTVEVRPGDSTGDTIEYTYLNATTGTNYVLESETADTVRDQKEASSPVTLVDDDSIETLAIFADSGGGSSSGGDGGGTGPIPTSTSDPNFLPLAGVALALGALVVVSRNNDTVSEAGSGAAEAVGGTLDGVPVVGPAAAGAVGGAIRSGSQLVAALFEQRIIAVLLGGAVAVGAVQGGIIDLGPSTQVLVAIAGVGIGSLVALREVDAFTPRRWAGIMAAATIVALQVLGTGDIISAVVDSQAFPIVLIALAGGALWLVQGLRQELGTPDQVTRIEVDGERRDGD